MFQGNESTEPKVIRNVWNDCRDEVKLWVAELMLSVENILVSARRNISEKNKAKQIMSFSNVSII